MQPFSGELSPPQRCFAKPRTDRAATIQSFAEEFPEPAMSRDQLVFERDNHLIAAGVALTSAAAMKLPVDAPGLVVLGSDDVETAPFGNATRQANIRSTPGHVCRDRNSPWFSSLGDDCRFFRILTRIKYPVRNSHS